MFVVSNLGDNRDLFDVLDQILEITPNAEKILIESIHQVQFAALEAPIEQMDIWWAAAASVFIERFPKPADVIEPWVREILAIWLDDPTFKEST